LRKIKNSNGHFLFECAKGIPSEKTTVFMGHSTRPLVGCGACLGREIGKRILLALIYVLQNKV
jgi:hypothetical protein